MCVYIYVYICTVYIYIHTMTEYTSSTPFIYHHPQILHIEFTQMHILGFWYCTFLFTSNEQFLISEDDDYTMIPVLSHDRIEGSNLLISSDSISKNQYNLFPTDDWKLPPVGRYFTQLLFLLICRIGTPLTGHVWAWARDSPHSSSRRCWVKMAAQVFPAMFESMLPNRAYHISFLYSP